MRGANSNTLDTISAAASAIASAENRVPQASSVQKRRWGSCLSIPWCFGSHKQTKRIGHAVFVPEPSAGGIGVSTAENPSQAPSRVLPFIAPPSSPASFLQSEPHSGFHSPAESVSFTSMSNYMYSPGPASMFAIGPYAHETQLVSPPVFSTFTTEPSTAPFTPPPESLQFTTPSSPEVPFASLFDPNHQNGKADQRFPFSKCEFQPYHQYAESPASHLISPGSGISASGNSSPFRLGDPPKLWNLDKLSAPEWGPRQGSGSQTPDAAGPRSQDSFPLSRQNSYLPPRAKSSNGRQNGEAAVDHRISFEVRAEDVLRCLAKEQSMARALSPLVENAEVATEKDGNATEVPNGHELDKASGIWDSGHRLQKHQSIYLGSVKEFNFENPDGGVGDSNEFVAVGSDWWSNEKALAEGGPKNWSFFPMIQPGVS